MSFTQKYTLAKPVWFNVHTNETSEEKFQGATYFPSTAEFNLYRRLLSLTSHLDIDIQPHSSLTFAETSWKLDFLLKSKPEDKRAQIILAKLANTANNSQFDALSQVYVEYKGLQDSNFQDKMGKLMSFSPITAKTIILVSSETAAFGTRHHNRNILCFLSKPILSIRDFELCFESSLE